MAATEAWGGRKWKTRTTLKFKSGNFINLVYLTYDDKCTVVSEFLK